MFGNKPWLRARTVIASELNGVSDPEYLESLKKYGHGPVSAENETSEAVISAAREANEDRSIAAERAAAANGDSPIPAYVKHTIG